LTLSSISSTTV